MRTDEFDASVHRLALPLSRMPLECGPLLLDPWSSDEVLRSTVRADVIQVALRRARK